MNYNYGLNDSNTMDISTAPSSSMGYFNQSSSQHQQNYNSNSFWRKPQSQPSSNQPYTPLTTAGSYSGMQSAGTGNDNQNAGLQGGEVDKLKMQLKIKESQIESLESEVQRLNESLAFTSGTLSSGNSSIPKKVPGSLNEVFVELSLKHGKALEELENTKMRLESLVTAMTLNPSNSVTNNGRYDELEISHKILIKLENLKKENEELMKQLSFGKVKQMETKMNLLKREYDTQKEIAEKLKRENEELILKLQEK